MDIQLLSTMVKELVLENDRVGLPGTGTFVAEEVGASFSDRGYAINPPYRRLTFSSAPCQDSLLVDMYSSSNGMDKDSAAAIVSRYLAEIRQLMAETGFVELPGLGRLRLTRSGAILFIPEEELELSPDTFGLPTVSLRSHNRLSDNIPLPAVPLPQKSEAPAPLPPSPEAAAAVPAAIFVSGPSEPEPPAPAPTPEPAVEQSEPKVPAEPAESSEPVPANEPEPAVEQSEAEVPAPAPEPSSQTPALGTDHRGKTLVKSIVVTISVLFILLAGFVILAKVAPEFMDTLLYTAEERAILDYPL